MSIATAPAFAQAEGDYRSRDSGDWSDAQIWERFNGSTWVAVATPPTGSETITVMATEDRTDSVFVDVATTISGHLVHQGIIATEGNLSVGDGGVYEYARDEGSMPIVNWEEGSTFLITGVTATAPANRNQNYYNITFNTPGLLSNLNMDLVGATIGGDIHVIETGVSRWYLTSALANDTSIVTIQGDVIVEAGAFSVQGTSNANTTFIVDHYGDIVVTGGNFSISRGSQGGGTTRWYLHGGNLSMENATTQSSTATPGGARFIFAGGGTQMLMLGEGNTITALPIEVAAGTTLDVGSSVLSGGGDFVVREGSVLATANPGGITGMFDELYVGADTLEANSSYMFNGTEAQVTSNLMPTVVQDLTINNAAGVVLSQETTINGVLHLVAGVFDNTIPFTLGDGASISEEGGSLLVPVSNESAGELPVTFFVEQNYPNPFNPSTNIRFGLPSPADVTVSIYNALGQRVRTLALGHKPAGEHEFSFRADGLSSGMYLYRIEAGEFIATRQMVLLE